MKFLQKVNSFQFIVLLLSLCTFKCSGAPKAVASENVIGFTPRSHVGAFIRDNENKLNLKSTSPVSKSNALDNAPSLRGGATAQQKELGGAFCFLVMNHALIKLFAAKNVSFPAPLGGCLLLFVLLLFAQTVKPGSGDKAFELLTPGANYLTKWMPVFFVPGLSMLPLAPSMGSPFEVVKVLSVVIIGFLFTMFSTGFAVLSLRQLQGLIVAPPASADGGETAAAAPSKPYSAELVDTLTKGLVLSAAASIGASRLDNKFATPLRTLFFSITAFLSYVWGARLPTGFVKVIHPLITSTVMTLVAVQATAVLIGDTFHGVLKTYKTGSLGLMTAGAGDILLYLLGPSVVAFAIAMYSRKQVMADNLLVIGLSVLVSSLGSLIGTASFVRLINLGGADGSVLRRSVLPRNVTTALAIAITQMIGGDISFAAAVVVLTGIFGATYGARILDAIGITDPVTRGLGMGASAQGLGVASMSNEKEAFPFAAISMVLTAVACTVLVSVPSMKDFIVNLAGAA